MTDVTTAGTPEPVADVAVEQLALSTAPADPADPPPSGRSVDIGRSARRFWRRLTSMRTALLLLVLLALAAIPGSVIPQTNIDPQSVADYLAKHPTLGPLAQHLGLFNVFGSAWFAAIYLLLFVSLIGCLVPRIRLHARALRRPPPPAPKRLLALSTSAGWQVPDEPEDVVASAAERLRAGRWRVAVTHEGGGAASVAAEKGFLRETGNLVFHVALLLLLCGVALSGLYGYKGQVLVVQHTGFADSLEAYNSFSQPRVGSVTPPPFSFVLNKFSATYQADSSPTSFDAQVSYKASPAAAAVPADIQVNHPLQVDGDNVYLINDGYAANFTVTSTHGRQVREQSDFLSDSGTTDIADSHGVVKVPDLRDGHQLGFEGELFSDFSNATGTSVSPAAKNPVVVLVAYRGNLGLNSGVAQDDFTLDTTGMRQIGGVKRLAVGQSWRLPTGDTVRFDGVTPYAVFQVAHSPGNWPSLIAAGLILVGLTLSLRVRRRRVWVRATPGEGGDDGPRTVVTAAGLTRSDPDGFAAEFARLVANCGGPPMPAGGDEE